MADPVGEWMGTLGEADPDSARELRGRRLRFELGDDPIREALRLLALAEAPLRVRLVVWDDGDPPDLGGPPDHEDRTPSRQGVARRILTWDRVAAGGADEVVRTALLANREIDVWIQDRQDRLWRPYDDRGVDVLAPRPYVLDPIRSRAGARLVEDTGDPTLRCTLALVCDVRWDALEPSDVERVRLCDRCDRPVFLVASAGEFHTMAELGRCVAVAWSTLHVEVPAGTAPPDREVLAGPPVRPTSPPDLSPPEPPPRPSWWRRLLG